MVLTKHIVSNWIEWSRIQDPSLSFTELILLSCEHFGIEIEDIKEFISDPIINSLEVEMMDIHLIKKDTDSTLKSFL